MKIGLFGNMNNNFFGLVRYLRDRGFDAELLYPNDADQFLPQADTYSLEYQGYARELNWNQESFYKWSKEQILEVLKPYDFLIACGYAAALIAKAGRTVDLYVPYGSDVYKYSYLRPEFGAWYKIQHFLKLAAGRRKYLVGDISLGTAHKYLRRAIREATDVICVQTNEDFESKLRGIAIRGNRHDFSIPFVYAPEYDLGKIEECSLRSHWTREFLELRKTYGLIILHHTRHMWKTDIGAFSSKGNERLIEGFAKFVQKEKITKPCLVMMEYGHDVPASKQLVRELGIESHVRWFPKMFRKDIMPLIHFADVCTGEFDRSWVMFGVIMEILAMGKPLIHYREDAAYKSSYPELYPMMNAKTPEQISAALSDYVKRPEYWKQKGEDGRRWFQKYVVDQPLDEIEKIIKSKAGLN